MNGGTRIRRAEGRGFIALLAYSINSGIINRYRCCMRPLWCNPFCGDTKKNRYEIHIADCTKTIGENGDSSNSNRFAGEGGDTND